MYLSSTKSINCKAKAFMNGFYFGLARLLSQTCSISNENSKKIEESRIPDNLPTKNSVLEICNEDVSDFSPYHVPSFNFAAYINKSPTLQKLVDLGVDLSKLEVRKGVLEFILHLDFERDMVKHIQFLCDIGVPADDLGKFITINPYIFSQSIDDLNVRIFYLQTKKFVPESISRIVQKNPKWLIYRTEEIDKRLGYFQLNFNLIGDEVRFVATRMPKLITYNLNHVEEMKFAVREEMGFSILDSKSILINKPKIYTLNRGLVVSRFSYIHNAMGIPHNLIKQQLGGLLCREGRLKQRHDFLCFIGKAQYNPLLPCYISLESIVAGNDAQFCEEVAKTPKF